MPPDAVPLQPTTALATPVVAGPATGARAVTIPALPRLKTSWLALAERPEAGRRALWTVVGATFAIVAFACAKQGVLVPRGYLAFPLWESGPLHVALRWLPTNQHAINIAFSFVVLIMLCAYGVAVTAVRTLSLRRIALTIVALHAIVLLSPPLQLTDMFNYLGYARLGGLHHMSPYTHVIADELHDPIYRFASWHNLRSPYGPLFTALTYPLGLLSMPLAYWIVKVTTMLSSLGVVALIYRCARQLGRDPRFAVVFVALNPIYIVYAMGGFHNDFLLLLPSLAAISLVLGGRDRSAGAVLMIAVAVKFTAILLLPFLLVAVRQNRRRRDVILGSALGALPLIVLSVALFGLHLPNLSDQSTLLTTFSVPQIVGLILGFGGGAPALLRVCNVLLVVTVIWLLRRPGNWLSRAGWATLALMLSLPWLMPWYAIWLLPLAAFGTSIRLRRAAALLTVYLVLTFIPITGIVLFAHGLNPMNTKVGHASSKLQKHLADGD